TKEDAKQMSQEDRIRWDQRYREGAYATREHPSAFLQERLPWIGRPQPGSLALDLACGRGRNALFLARQGFHVDAVDISPEALQGAREAAEAAALDDIRWTQHDLDEGLDGIAQPQQEAQQYKVALIMRYLDLSLLQATARWLQPGGHLLCEVHLQTALPVAGPSNPAFRAAPGEVREAASGLHILLYQEGLIQDPDGETVCLARLHARRPA